MNKERYHLFYAVDEHTLLNNPSANIENRAFVQEVDKETFEYWARWGSFFAKRANQPAPKIISSSDLANDGAYSAKQQAESAMAPFETSFQQDTKKEYQVIEGKNTEHKVEEEKKTDATSQIGYQSGCYF